MRTAVTCALMMLLIASIPGTALAADTQPPSTDQTAIGRPLQFHLKPLSL